MANVTTHGKQADECANDQADSKRFIGMLAYGVAAIAHAIDGSFVESFTCMTGMIENGIELIAGSHDFF